MKPQSAQRNVLILKNNFYSVFSSKLSVSSVFKTYAGAATERLKDGVKRLIL